jgi:hypothetical protein
MASGPWQVQLVVGLARYVVDVEVHYGLSSPLACARDEVEGVTARAGVACCSHGEDACPEWGLRSVLDVEAGDEDPMSGRDRVKWREGRQPCVSYEVLRLWSVATNDATEGAVIYSPRRFSAINFLKIFSYVFHIALSSLRSGLL